MEGVLALLIALLGVCIPVIVLTGRHIVQPLVEVLSRLTTLPEHQVPAQIAEQNFAELSDRTDRIERVLTQVIEEQQFQRALQEGDTLNDSPRRTSAPSPR